MKASVSSAGPGSVSVDFTDAKKTDSPLPVLDLISECVPGKCWKERNGEKGSGGAFKSESERCVFTAAWHAEQEGIKKTKQQDHCPFDSTRP